MAFDVIDGLPVQDWLIDTLGLPETEPLNMNFEALGYESSLIMLNLGSLLFMIAIFPVVALFLPVMKLFGSKIKLRV